MADGEDVIYDSSIVLILVFAILNVFVAGAARQYPNIMFESKKDSRVLGSFQW